MRSRARALRRKSTDAEAKLWAALRDRRLGGMKWRRQVPIGPYIVDFVCLDRRIIVECDGSQHAESRYDSVRSACLETQGFKVLRFWNRDALKDRASVVETILATCGLPV
jgi:very-short-patch-repair endonuclease